MPSQTLLPLALAPGDNGAVGFQCRKGIGAGEHLADAAAEFSADAAAIAALFLLAPGDNRTAIFDRCKGGEVFVLVNAAVPGVVCSDSCSRAAEVFCNSLHFKRGLNAGATAGGGFDAVVEFDFAVPVLHRREGPCAVIALLQCTFAMAQAEAFTDLAAEAETRLGDQLLSGEAEDAVFLAAAEINRFGNNWLSRRLDDPSVWLELIRNAAAIAALGWIPQLMIEPSVLRLQMNHGSQRPPPALDGW